MSTGVTLQQISKLLDQKLEEKLSQKLAPIYKKLDEHTRILNEHTKILNEHTQILNQHTQVLNEHTQILKEHSMALELLTKMIIKDSMITVRHDKQLKQYGKLLDRFKKTQGRIINSADKARLRLEQMGLSSRMNVIEDHLGITPG